MGETYVNIISPDFQKGVDSEGKTQIFQFHLYFFFSHFLGVGGLVLLDNASACLVRVK
jgi:hypothetical protein